MGIRFRKSVKICKGVRINFSKSGASLSLGGKGHRVTLGGSSAVRVTTGIPGTGLSYSTTLGGGHKHHTTRQASKHSTGKKNAGFQNSVPNMPRSFMLRMNEKGKVDILDENQNIITDPTVIRFVMQSPQFVQQKQQLEVQRQNQISEIVRASQEENERFINIHSLSPIGEALVDFEQRLNSLQPNRYIPAQFLTPMPNEQAIRTQLVQEAKISVTGSIFTVGRMREQYVNEHIKERYSLAMSEWERNRSLFLQAEENKRIEMDNSFNEEYQRQKTFLISLINGEDEAVSEVFDAWIESCQLPVEINVNYDWNSSSKVMMLDVDLPEIEDICETKMIRTDTGNLKEKKKTQSELRGEYARLVFGLALFVTSNTFNVSPAIQKVVISGYTQRRDKNGNLNDDYIYSMKFPRNMFENKNVAVLVDPIDYCMRAENRCNMTSTSLFKTIKPFEADE